MFIKPVIFFFLSKCSRVFFVCLSRVRVSYRVWVKVGVRVRVGFH